MQYKYMITLLGLLSAIGTLVADHSPSRASMVIWIFIALTNVWR